MNPICIFGLNLRHASFHLVRLGVVLRAVSGLYVAVVPAAPRGVLFGTRCQKLLLLLELLGRREFAVVVDGASSHTHYTVDVDWTVSIIHGVTFSPIHDIAIL